MQHPLHIPRRTLLLVLVLSIGAGPAWASAVGKACGTVGSMDDCCPSMKAPQPPAPDDCCEHEQPVREDGESTPDARHAVQNAVCICAHEVEVLPVRTKAAPTLNERPVLTVVLPLAAITTDAASIRAAVQPLRSLPPPGNAPSYLTSCAFLC